MSINPIGETSAGVPQSSEVAPKQPSLDEVFSGILNDQSLQEEIRKTEEQQRREEEVKYNQPYLELGKEFYNSLTTGENSFTEPQKQYWNNALQLFQINIPGPNSAFVNELKPEEREKLYMEDLRRTFRTSKTLGEGWARSELPVRSRLRYILKGFGMAALEDGKVAASLLALDEGNWLDDQFEGPGLQKQITEKVAALTDPKAKVDAAMTWKKIQEAKAPPPAAASIQPPVTP